MITIIHPDGRKKHLDEGDWQLMVDLVGQRVRDLENDIIDADGLPHMSSYARVQHKALLNASKKTYESLFDLVSEV